MERNFRWCLPQCEVLFILLLFPVFCFWVGEIFGCPGSDLVEWWSSSGSRSSSRERGPGRSGARCRAVVGRVLAGGCANLEAHSF